jgi:2-(1,2-epoxy-1,2-dihydrophenyl)acetyl-CoA isomerase
MLPVLFTVEEGIATITLNRPDKLNSFNREMALLLQQKLDECAADPAVRCVYITGAGKGFCAGQDLAEVVDFARRFPWTPRQSACQPSRPSATSPSVR